MGYVKHNAIIVTSWNADLIDAAHNEAKRIGCDVTGIVGPTVNGYNTFCVVPDGSKEGWSESDEGDRARDVFVAWLNAQKYEDKSTPFEWCEVFYGSDDRKAGIVRHAHSRAARAATGGEG